LGRQGNDGRRSHLWLNKSWHLLIFFCYLTNLAQPLFFQQHQPGSELIKTVELSKVLPNAVEFEPCIYIEKGFNSTPLGRTLQGSSFFINSVYQYVECWERLGLEILCLPNSELRCQG
jgi:hypothetical protein